MSRYGRYRHRRTRSCAVAAMARRVSLFGVATAAILALYRQFRSVVLAIAPAYSPDLDCDAESDRNRAGRLAELKVAQLFEGIPGLEVYQSLRIPDPGHRGRREVDIVLLTNRDLFVVEVKHWSGFIEKNLDGSWSQTRRNGSVIVHADVLEELNYRTNLLESYIERRGVTLPPGFVQPKVFFVNRECRMEQAITMLPEVLGADQWKHFLNYNLERMDSGWMKSTHKSGKSDFGLSELERKQLRYILSTAPTWDRMELESGRIVVGEFKEFKGRPEDAEVLAFAKRSSVSNLSMTHRRGWMDNLFGTPKVQVVVTVRDYRDGNANWSKKQRQDPLMQTRLRAETDIVFQVVGTSKPQLFSLSEVHSLSLSS